MNIGTSLRQIKSALKAQLPIDMGSPKKTIFIAGVGRSGTTWLGDLINHDKSYRVLFEPFHSDMVEKARIFTGIKYIPKSFNESPFRQTAKDLLNGKIKGYWVDRDNNRKFYYKRIIKDIRCNPMLDWLLNINPQMRLILLLRHPMQVTHSWLKLGWESHYENILGQEELLHDFPIIGEISQKVNSADPFQKNIFSWCVNTFIPLRNLTAESTLVIFYENLIRQEATEIERLSRHLNNPALKKISDQSIRKISSTNFLKRDTTTDRQNLIYEWKSKFSKSQIDFALNMLSEFGLNHLYDHDGVPRSGSFFTYKMHEFLAH